MVRNSARRRIRETTPNDLRSDKQVSRLVGTALRQCLAQEGVSVRQAARLLRVAKSTAEKYRRDGFVIPILRSRRLSLCFVANLHLLVSMRNGKAA
jgi:hypothetical protein